MRKIVVEITLEELDEELYDGEPATEFIHDMLYDEETGQHIVGGDFVILSDTADPQVGRKAERLCPECLKAYDYKKEMSLQWVCEHCGYRTDAEEAGE